MKRVRKPACLCREHRQRAVAIRFDMARFPAKSAWVTWSGEKDAKATTLAGPFEEMSGAEDWLRAQATDPVCLEPYAPVEVPAGYARVIRANPRR